MHDRRPWDPRPYGPAQRGYVALYLAGPPLRRALRSTARTVAEVRDMARFFSSLGLGIRKGGPDA